MSNRDKLDLLIERSDGQPRDGSDIGGRTVLGHPPGLFLLFLVEMWERFSYYGMRALLVLYLVRTAAGENPGRGWSKENADGLYGWYTGMAYLLPILGGYIADKLIGTHRSLVVGACVIALGHMVLAVSGMGDLAHNSLGMSIFVMGLVLIVLGTGHFKPNVSVMVDKLYPTDDRRRDGAFTIFYMGVNVGAFIGPLVCSFLGEKIGWHWGFGAAAVGMILGLIAYLTARPRFLPRIGAAPAGKPNYAPLMGCASIVIAIGIAALFHFHILADIGARLDAFIDLSPKLIMSVFFVTAIGLAAALVISQLPEDRGPTACILLFVVFNAVFWLAFEQAGSSLNHFADERTNRTIGGWEIPAGWFQSVGALLIIVLAPVFTMLWTALARRDRNPSQPIKLALALWLVGGGYVFMVLGAMGPSVQKASMFWLIATYFMHTLGELCMSPTGLSFLTKVAPVRSVSLLMGIWFLSNAIANKVGGELAGQIEKIESGEISLFWYRWFRLGGQADFFLLFVVSSIGAGILVLLLTPLMKRLLAGRG
jgi:POT family proton-dependent oligopeptide transporter